MIVFKTFLKILNKNKWLVLMYTVILIAFGGISATTSETNLNFTASKPDIYIINQDEEIGITKNLIEYISQNSNIMELENNEFKINDALFYRDVNYIIYIPKNFRIDFLNKKNPQIEIKSTKDYQASLAQMLLEKYLDTAQIYLASGMNEKDIIKNVNNTLETKVNIELTSQLDTNNLEKATLYYNFASYSILAGCVYVICMILSSFKETKIVKRTLVSSTNNQKINHALLLSNALFAIFMWLIYCLLSIILLGNIVLSKVGILYMLNAFIFSTCTLTIAFFIANIVKNKNAINGLVNVIALGSSFLCGAFVPMEWLPNSVLKIAHILPTYYYIKNNELLKEMEVFNKINLMPIFINMVIILLFCFGFVILTNYINKHKKTIG